MSSVCTRFAPSPTGYLHVGGARTALFSYLFARKNQGRFLLRIEDTDLERSTPESVQAILDGMSWLGLAADQAPIFQTARFDIYKKHIQDLLDQGKAYKCYCSKERLEKLREEQISNKQKARYDGCCRDKHPGELAGGNQDFVVRFKNPLEGDVVFKDLVLGEIKVNNRELDDLIIARSDGSPTYNFTVVVDDAEMEITHVIRGNDHINNTPRQINLYQALGFSVPEFAHVPMILGDDGKRLSKRHGAVSVMQYQENGYLPQALLNYLVRLGWSHGDEEIFSLEQMVEYFSLEKISKSAAAFNTEKLQWLNQHYIKTLPVEEVATALGQQYKILNIDACIKDAPKLESVVEVLKDRSKTLREMAESSRFWFEEIGEYDQVAWDKFMSPEAKAVLERVYQDLDSLPGLESEWTAENIKTVVNSVVCDLGLKFPQVAQPIRIAVTGNTISPSVDATLSLLGKERSLSRVKSAILKL